MPKTALIIEDDESAGKLLEALCKQLGVETNHVRHGKEGLERACADAPDLVIMDMLLPGLDGFKIAEGIRKAKVASAIVAVSGVYKDPKVAKDLADRFGADFFQKPFKNDEVLAAIARRLGLSQPQAPAAPVAPRRPSFDASPTAAVGPMEGDLRSKSFPELLMELLRGKGSGTLDLTQGQIKKRIYFNRGMVRFAQSNVKSENVGGMQVAQGILTEEQFRSAVGKAKAEGISVGEALAISALLPHDVVAKATRQQVEEVCVTACGWREGSYKFLPNNTDRIQDVRHDPIALALSGFKRFVSPADAQAELVSLSKGTLARTPEFERALFTMRSVFPGETLTPMINGRQTVGEVLARARKEDLPLLIAGLRLGMVSVTGVEAERKETARAAFVPSRPYTVEEEAARETIRVEHARVMSAPDLFGVLRLPRGASIEEVKAAYLPLAKRFHADAFSGLMLGDAEDKVREMFARISEAHSTLSDAKRRADYEVFLERKDAGLPTDVEVIFKAEAACGRGEALMGQGRFSDAEGLFREALKLDASVAQYHASLAQALLKGRGAGGVGEAKEALEKALALNPESLHARILKATARGLEGDVKAAEGLLREVLAVQPDNADAMREFRALKERSKKDEGKGLRGKLFKR